MKPIATLIIAIAILLASCQKITKPTTTTAEVPADTFSIVVGTTTYKVANEPIEVQGDIILRGHSNQLAVIAYLDAVADGVASVVNVCDAVKGEKLTTFNVWLKLVPVLTKEIPSLVRSGKSLAQFNTLYTNAQGLTPQERAAVATAFATKFALPQEEAEKIAELVIESAIINMKLAGTIKTAVATKKNRE